MMTVLVFVNGDLRVSMHASHVKDVMKYVVEYAHIEPSDRVTFAAMDGAKRQTH